MKIKMALLVLVFLVLMGCEDNLAVLNNYNLNGDVKSVTEDYYEVVEENGIFFIGDAVQTNIERYDENHILIYNSYCNYISKYNTNTAYKYNEKDRYVEFILYENDIFVQNKIIYYDKNNTIIKIESFDRDNNLRVNKTITEDRDFTKYIEYKLQEPKQEFEDSDEVTYILEYDERNNWISKEVYYEGLYINKYLRSIEYY